MIDKRKYRYSNVELIDIIKNGINKTEIKKASSELESRNLTLEQKNNLDSEYLKYKEFKEKRRSEPLTTEEWFTFLIFPFFTPIPQYRSGKDHFSESEMKRFKKYGFSKKTKQAEKVKLLGVLFWILIFFIVGILYKKFFE